MSHTPGPWRAEGATVKAVSHGQWFKITRADGRGHTAEGNENNARLIAASPDMLDALETISAWLIAPAKDEATFEYIERVTTAALAKAKGQA